MKLLNYGQLYDLANRYAPAQRAGSPNRHDRKRWVHSILADMAVADDAVESDERGRAARILIEHLTLRDAIAALDGKVLPVPDYYAAAARQWAGFEPRPIEQIREGILDFMRSAPGGSWAIDTGLGTPIRSLVDMAASQTADLERQIADQIREQLPDGAQIDDLQVTLLRDRLQVDYRARMPGAIRMLNFKAVVEV